MEQTIHFRCSNCGMVLRVPSRLAGKSGRCPNCRELTAIPQASTVSVPPQPAPPPPPPEPPTSQGAVTDELRLDEFITAASDETDEMPAMAPPPPAITAPSAPAGQDELPQLPQGLTINMLRVLSIAAVIVVAALTVIVIWKLSLSKQ